MAEALKDPELYERATLLSSPEPNDLQKKSIIQILRRSSWRSRATSYRLILNLNQPDRAQQLVLANPEGISNCFYGSLLELVQKLEQQKYWLAAATACYRSLLCDILNQGRSKAYTHAARYYKKLAVISRQIQYFEPLEQHAEFLLQLKDKHGLKGSFWQRVM